ncbi:DsbA family protein [Georgenia sp. Z1491]|uniref:DsbA family protein n=1 Tax=Georgenia sp. Z1491 TaxID=3416707 RepID=UPI003CF0D9AD
MSRTARPALAAGVLGAALALASCSSDPEDPAATESGTEQDAPDEDEDARAETEAQERADEDQERAEESRERAEEAAAVLEDVPTTDVDVVAEDPAYPTAVGEADAEVTMVVFEDYLCSYCQAMATQSMPELQDLVDDGTLRIEYRDVGVLAQQSLTLAEAAWAAGQQDGFIEYHDALMAEPMQAAQVTTEALVERATEVGLDAEQFAADLEDPATAEQIRANGRLATDLELTGTPTTVVGGYVMVGLQDAETLRLAVEGVASGGTPGGAETESGEGASDGASEGSVAS